AFLRLHFAFLVLATLGRRRRGISLALRLGHFGSELRRCRPFLIGAGFHFAHGAFGVGHRLFGGRHRGGVLVDDALWLLGLRALGRGRLLGGRGLGRATAAATNPLVAPAAGD